MDILKVLLLITIFAFPFGEVLRIQFNNGIAVTVNDILVFTTTFFWFLLQLKKKVGIHNNIIKPIGLFVGFGFLSLVIHSRFLSTAQFFISVLYLLRWVLYVGLFFIVNEFPIAVKNTISKSMIMSGFIVIVLGFFQYTFYQNLKNLYYLGWDDHLYRMFSTFLDPNFAGIFFVLYALFILGFLFKTGQKFFKKEQVIYILLLLVTVIAIFFTFSRSALLSFIASIIVFFFLKKKKVFIFIFACFIIIFITISSRNFYIENMNLFRTVSSQARVGSAIEALDIFKKNPLTGIGFNSYRYEQVRLGYRNKTNADKSHADGSTDNSFLFVLATTGIIGLIFYLSIYWYVFKQILYKKSKNNMYRDIIISSLVAVGINALFINSLFYTFIMEWMWFMIGLGIKDREAVMENK